MSSNPDLSLPAAQPANGAAIVLLPAVSGVNDYIRRVGSRFASQGYAVSIIDYYAGAAVAPDLSTPEKIAEAVASLSAESVLLDVRRAIAELRGPGGNQRVGVVGYCIGGAFALLAGCESRNADAVVNYYGTVRYGGAIFGKTGAPLERAEQLAVPMLMHYGTADRVVPEDDVRSLENVLLNGNRTFELFRYGGAPHAFDEDFRPAYRPASAEEAWARSTAFLRWYLVLGARSR